MSRVGLAVGFPHYSAFGLMAGEWKGASRRTTRFLAAALAFILIAVIVLNLGGIF